MNYTGMVPDNKTIIAGKEKKVYDYKIDFNNNWYAVLIFIALHWPIKAQQKKNTRREEEEEGGREINEKPSKNWGRYMNKEEKYFAPLFG